MTTTHENKGQSTSDIVLVILKNYSDARNNECKKKCTVLFMCIVCCSLCDSQESLPVVKCALLYGRSSDSHPDRQIRTSAAFVLQSYRFVVFFISFSFCSTYFFPRPTPCLLTINLLIMFLYVFSGYIPLLKMPLHPYL